MVDYSQYWEDLLTEDYRLVQEGKYGSENIFKVHYGDIIQDGQFVINPKWRGLAPRTPESFVLINQQNTISIKGDVYLDEKKVKEGIYRILDSLQDVDGNILPQYNRPNPYTWDNIFKMDRYDIHGNAIKIVHPINANEPNKAQGIITEYIDHEPFLWKVIPANRDSSISVRADGTFSYTGVLVKVDPTSKIPMETAGESNRYPGAVEPTIFLVEYTLPADTNISYIPGRQERRILANMPLTELLDKTYDESKGIATYRLSEKAWELWNRIDFDIRDYDLIPIAGGNTSQIQFRRTDNTIELRGIIINHEGFQYKPGRYPYHELLRNPESKLINKTDRWFLTNCQNPERAPKIEDVTWQWGNGHQNFRYVPYITGSMSGDFENACFAIQSDGIIFSSPDVWRIANNWFKGDDTDLILTRTIVNNTIANEPFGTGYTDWESLPTLVRRFIPGRHPLPKQSVRHIAMGRTMGFDAVSFRHEFFNISKAEMDKLSDKELDAYAIDFGVFPWKIGAAKETGFQLPYWNGQFYDLGQYVYFNQVGEKYNNIHHQIEFCFNLEHAKLAQLSSNSRKNRIRNLFTLDREVHPLYQFKVNELTPLINENQYNPVFYYRQDNSDEDPENEGTVIKLYDRGSSQFRLKVDEDLIGPFYGHGGVNTDENTFIPFLPLGESSYVVTYGDEGETLFTLNPGHLYLMGRRLIRGDEVKLVKTKFSRDGIGDFQTIVGRNINYRLDEKIPASWLTPWSYEIIKREDESVVTDFVTFPKVEHYELGIYGAYFPFVSKFMPGVEYQGLRDFGLPYNEGSPFLKYVFLNNMDDDIIGLSVQDGSSNKTAKVEFTISPDAPTILRYNNHQYYLYTRNDTQVRMYEVQQIIKATGDKYDLSWVPSGPVLTSPSVLLGKSEYFTDGNLSIVPAGDSSLFVPFSRYQNSMVRLIVPIDNTESDIAGYMDIIGPEGTTPMLSYSYLQYPPGDKKKYVLHWGYIQGPVEFDNTRFALYCDRFQGSTYLSGYFTASGKTFLIDYLFAQGKQTAEMQDDWIKMVNADKEGRKAIFQKLTDGRNNTAKMGYIVWTGYPESSYVVQPFTNDRERDDAPTLATLMEMQGEETQGCYPIRDGFGNVVKNGAKLSSFLLPEGKSFTEGKLVRMSGEDRYGKWENRGQWEWDTLLLPNVFNFCPDTTLFDKLNTQPFIADTNSLPTTYANNIHTEYVPYLYRKTWLPSYNPEGYQMGYYPISSFIESDRETLENVTNAWTEDPERLKNWVEIDKDANGIKTIALRDFGYTLVPGVRKSWFIKHPGTEEESEVFISSYGELFIQGTVYFDIGQTELPPLSGRGPISRPL